LEVSFPGKGYNVYGNRYYLIVGCLGLNPDMTIVLNDNLLYHTLDNRRDTEVLCRGSNSERFSDDKFIVQIRYANRHKCVKILFTKYTFRDNWIYFSDDLTAMLGFEPNKYHWFNDAERPVLLSAGTGNFYVYCDLLEHVMETSRRRCCA